VGVNNKQRRAAKKKKAQVHRGSARPWAPFVPEPTPELARQRLMELLAVIDGDRSAAEPLAEQLLRPDGLLPPTLAMQALRALLAELTATVVAHGWTPSDLAQIVARQLSEARVPTALALLVDEAQRHPADRVSPRWLADLDACGLAVPLDLRDVPTVRAALELATCLATLPPIAVLLPAPGATGADRVAGGTAATEAKLLAKVRGLLAKAEATDYDEEAEALSSKAQELISRHALERLLAASDAPGAPGTATAARRIWVEPPYVFAKALLVGAVADANRCRSVVSEGLGFCTLLGDERDLVAVDVLVTSLLLQAGAAMRRHGRQLDRSGTSRTRSFRQSFLVAYAGRIRERLQAAADDAVHSSGRAGELVPVLHRQAERLDEATAAMFPELTQRAAAVGNAQGWVAGRAAADAAQLSTGLQLDADAPLSRAAG
jgi:hypothetical protein